MSTQTKEKATVLAIPTAPLHVARFAIQNVVGQDKIQKGKDEEEQKRFTAIAAFRNTMAPIVARGVTGILEGAGVYGLTYLLSPSFTAVAGAPGVALQAIGAVVGGLWLGNGKSWSGMISGSLVGGVAVGVYHLAPFIANALGVGELEGHLIAGVITILATFLIEGASGYIAYHRINQTPEGWIQEDKSFEYRLHNKFIKGVESLKEKIGKPSDNYLKAV